MTPPEPRWPQDPYIREETPVDADAVRRLNEAAFERPQEARLISVLRDHGGVLLSLVAVAAGRVVGHVLFTPVTVSSRLATVWGAGLGPMAVRPDLQRHGIGSRLVAEGTRRLRKRSCPFVVVLGHPEYYPRFGFEVASRHGLRCPWDAPDAAFMVLPLGSAPLSPGLVSYRDEFSTVT
jgi:putative acetyltransferase